MSQFISANQPYENDTHSNPSILRGVLYKILAFTSNSPLLKHHQNRSYLKQKISMKFRHQQNKAHLEHNQSLMSNYFNLKNKLSQYGRSKSCKVQQFFDGINRTSIREPIQQAKKIMLKNDSPERLINIGKKYNHELAIKTAVLSQMQQIQNIKKKRKQVLSKYFRRSLSEYMNDVRQKSKVDENPVLCISQGTKLRKKKKKILFS